MKNYCLVLKLDFEALLPQEKKEIVSISNSNSSSEFARATLSGNEYLIIELISELKLNNFLKTCEFFTQEQLLKIIDSGEYDPTANLYSSSAWTQVNTFSPFASKKINGKRLFKRVHGIAQNCIVGENIFEFIVPYDQCKITGLEIVGAQNCDTADLEIYDSDVNPISGYAGIKLNQFGFSVNVCKDYYEHKSEYDADLYLGMKLEMHFFAQAAGLIGINFILNELKL